MLRRRWAGGFGLGLLWACRVGPPEASGAVVPVEASPLDTARPRASSGLAERVGQSVELRIPLLVGGFQDLAEYRGHRVILELVDPTSAGLAPAQKRDRALLDAHSDSLIVVRVALEPSLDRLPAAWGDTSSPVVLGWDPQGAVAARLGVVILPTVVLLDDHGAIVRAYEGIWPDDAALVRWLGTG